MEQKMRKVGMLMNIYMGITLSLCLSITGNLSSGKGFIPPLFLITFLVSAVIALIIGFAVPIGLLSRNIHAKVKGFGGHILDALVSDLIYTPVITLVMILIVRKAVPVFIARSGGEVPADLFPPFIVMYLGSLALCFCVAFVLIMIFQPLYMKLAMKQCGVGPMNSGKPE